MNGPQAVRDRTLRPEELEAGLRMPALSLPQRRSVHTVCMDVCIGHDSHVSLWFCLLGDPRYLGHA